MITTLEDVRADVAACLTKAASDRHAPMHTPVVSSGDGELRVMVLRAFDPVAWTLRFHTDARSPKVAAIAADARVGVLLYDPAAKRQVRCRGLGRLEQEGVMVDMAWAASSEYARRCYLATGAPGTPLPAPGSGLPQEVEGMRPDEADLVPARENFAVLQVTLSEVDWLYLAHDGHRRAQFAVGGEGRWVVP